ncbi:hypothetical protein HJD18_06025 [Thermoleophilia bacterium SCSIO 60948]|nr:hypothetical protein HJD18_06025 [Thermoleophilia bacterium SCSIO 60948]
MRLEAEGRPRYEKRVERERCPRCWASSKPIRFGPADYAQLLGLYLGDGCISRQGRTFRLRIALDAAYPEIVSATAELLRRGFPANPVAEVRGSKGNYISVSVHCAHLPCLLPQHGPGRKHERDLSLEAWQSALLEEHPWSFLCGCIWSDGCSFVNRTGRYEYLAYGFANRSEQIASLFEQSCDRVGVRCRKTYSATTGLWQIRVNRRGDVARFLRHVGRKA